MLCATGTATLNLAGEAEQNSTYAFVLKILYASFAFATLLTTTIVYIVSTLTASDVQTDFKILLYPPRHAH